MPVVVCIVGRPKTGKTTLIEKLIPELKNRGYRVATIKHTTHDFEMDTEGKDSFKHARAGSECALLASAGQVMLMRQVDHDFSPAELVRLVSSDFDIVLAEGFKRSDETKIEVARKATELVCDPHELLAMVTEDHAQSEPPRYSPDNIQGLATLIEERVLKRNPRIAIYADGKPVVLKPFIASLYYKVFMDMVLSLKGMGKPKRFDISFRR